MVSSSVTTEKGGRMGRCRDPQYRALPDVHLVHRGGHWWSPALHHCSYPHLLLPLLQAIGEAAREKTNDVNNDITCYLFVFSVKYFNLVDYDSFVDCSGNMRLTL